jgi:hypothetical protein
MYLYGVNFLAHHGMHALSQPYSDSSPFSCKLKLKAWLHSLVSLIYMYDDKRNNVITESELDA